MPIPLIVWGVVAVGGAYLAYKNKDKLADVMTSIGEGLEEQMGRYVEIAENDLSKIERLSVSEAINVAKSFIPNRDIWEYGAFRLLLSEKARTDRQSEKLLEAVSELRREFHPDEDLALVTPQLNSYLLRKRSK